MVSGKLATSMVDLLWFRRFIRTNKNNPKVDEVELPDVNPTDAHVRYPDGRESTVSLR